MKTAFRLLPLAAAVAVSIPALLSACNSTTPGDTSSGVVTGSYFRHAKVCLDQNGNGRCDSGEPSTYTDSNGAYTLPGNGGAMVAEIGTDAVRYDPDTSTATPVTQKMVFRAPAESKGVISAITTELQALVDDGMTLADAKADLAQRIGVPVDKLLEDLNREGDSNIKSLLKTEGDAALTRIAEAAAEAGSSGDVGKALRNRFALDNKIKTIVVIYAENRGFDNLYGLFPGANGIPGVNASAVGSYIKQKDTDGSTELSVLPPAWGNLTAGGQSVTLTQAESASMANAPFQIDNPAGLNGTGKVIGQNITTRDLWHRYYQNQMQINGGKNDMFATYGDAGGLTMGYYDGSSMKMWNIAQQYTLADNFFMGAFGGSFLNHQYLICACAPQYPNADTSPAHPVIAQPDSNGKLLLTGGTGGLSSAPAFPGDGNITPADNTGMFYAVNTMQPPYQPASNAPAGSDSTRLYTDTSKANTLPPQTQQNIGDLLTAKGVTWAWYAGAWNSTLANATSASRSSFSNPPNFQFHHQPFNYFANMDPVTHASNRTAHLRDYDTQFLSDVAAGTLPQVTFYKPQGNLNQHPGYANVKDGDDHIADVIAKLKASPQWNNMLVVVTYDENGGFWDHVAVPKADRWGPATRIPAIVISPYAKKGYIDHTQYDTASILRLITHRFSLPALPGLVQRDVALVANGGKVMGDLTNALDLTQTP